MKASSILLALILVLAFSITFTASTATAGGMGNGAAQRQKLVIDSIDASTGTVVFKSMIDQSIHTYKIDASTRISIVNKKATIDQLTVGQKVENYVAENGQPPQTLKSLLVSKAVASAPAVPASQ